MPLVAGVDSSTQATKVEIRDADSGTLVASASAPHPSVTPPVAEQDPSAWWDAFGVAFARARDQAGSPVAAISVAGQQHGMVCLDERFDVIRPAKLWCDTTSAVDAEWLIDRHPGGAAGWAQACGSVPGAALTIAKLSWLHHNEPESWSRLRHVALPHDWITFRLTGRLTTDRGDASGTGYWSPSEDRYRRDLLDIVDDSIDWAEALPEVLGPVDEAGHWVGGDSDGPDGPVAVGPGTGDNMAAALGIGLVEGDVAISIGTSGTVFGVARTASADASGMVQGFADATGRFLPLVCTLNATKVTDAVARMTGFSDLAELDASALAEDAGAGGVTLVPYFDGERTPNLPWASGCYWGLRSDTSRGQLARAAFEGVVCGLLDGLDALVGHAETDGDLHLVGGGARSVAYRQILADLAGRPVLTTDLAEAVATGACVQAAAVLHRRDPDEVRAAWADITAAHLTEPTGESRTAEIRERYHTLRAAVAELGASPSSHPTR